MTDTAEPALHTFMSDNRTRLLARAREKTRAANLEGKRCMLRLALAAPPDGGEA